MHRALPVGARTIPSGACKVAARQKLDPGEKIELEEYNCKEFLAVVRSITEYPGLDYLRPLPVGVETLSELRELPLFKGKVVNS